MNSDKIAYRIQEALTEAVMEGEIALDDANSFLAEAEGITGVPFGQLDRTRTVVVRGRISFNYETTMEIPLEPDEGSNDEQVVGIFERLVDNELGQDETMSVMDVQVTEAEVVSH